MDKDSTMLTPAALSRRTFVKAGGVLGALAVVSGSSLGALLAFQQQPARAFAESEEKITWGHCAINCPGRCSLKMHIKDDEIVQVETFSIDDDDIDSIQPRACLRGRSYRAWAYHPDRINYPLKRTPGTLRGDGKYDQITWDEAIELIATNLKDVIKNYGNESVFWNYGTGVSASTARPWGRLLNLMGGYLTYYGSYSTAEISWITPYIYGSAGSGSTLSAIRDADMVMIFGSSMAETRQGGAVSNHDWVADREKTKAKNVYVVDPRYSDSCLGHSAQWLPINPGTDAAFVSGIAHELITQNWVDKDFLDTYAVGYDDDTMPDSAKGQKKSYKDYILGTGYDMKPKTPEWAAGICGISVSKIKQIAKELHEAKAAYIGQGWGSQRRSNGELTAWAICMLAILTGNIGLPGTSTGLREGSYSISLSSIPAGDNPIKTKISVFSMVDAIDRGDQMTEKADGVTGADKLKNPIKFVINYAGNCITNQNSDINWVHDVMRDDSKCQFVLGVDIVMCDSLKYCDVILPDLFRFEQHSMIGTGGDAAYMICGTPATTPKYERKTCYEVISLLSKAVGLEKEFTDGKTEEDWIKQTYEESRAKDTKLPTYEEAVKMGVYTRANPKGATIALEAFRKDPVENKLTTPSGKIEIYSEKLATYIAAHEFQEDDHPTPIPTYVPEWYGVETTTEELPLVLTGFHYRGRLHSSWGNIETLKELNPQEVWINEVDAKPRGIMSGDKVHVTNQFGVVELLARVTPRLVPGTVGISQGAWHDADMTSSDVQQRVDKGGSINTLTTHRPAPFSKGNPQHTNICEVKKV
jgi:Tat-targeted selenate reductase subunit YnfE